MENTDLSRNYEGDVQDIYDHINIDVDDEFLFFEHREWLTLEEKKKVIQEMFSSEERRNGRQKFSSFKLRRERRE